MQTMPPRLPRPAEDHSPGQALVEFALVLPVMLLILLLTVDFGRVFFGYIDVNNAAREGAFYAAEHASDVGYKQDAFDAATIRAGLIEANVQSQGGEGALTISEPICFGAVSSDVVPCNSAALFSESGGIGNMVAVSASRSFTFLTPIVGDIFNGEMTASATAPVLTPPAISIVAGEVPTPAPTPAAAATPAPGATPTPAPTPTPSPSPTPATMCTVPDFKHTFWNGVGGPASDVWHGRGFSGILTDQSADHKIQSQTLPAGDPYLCSSNMIVDNN